MKNLPEWYRKRSYLHFDVPVSAKSAEKIVTNPSNVAKHSFYPLISYAVVTSKLKKDKDLDELVRVPKERPIAYAAHVDSHIYSYYSHVLSQAYEGKISSLGLSENILAFRALGKSNIEFAKHAFDIIRNTNGCGVVALDITGFFDNLNHVILKKSWAWALNEIELPPDHYNIFKSLTKFSVVRKNHLYERFSISRHNPKNGRARICSPIEFRNIVRRENLIKTNSKGKGIPQGTPISALLSNIYMTEFDRRVKDAVDEQGGVYLRYCDDMLLIVPAEYTESAAGYIREEIKNIGLDINPKKTEIRKFTLHGNVLRSDKPLQYLGFTFDGSSVLIRSAALARYSEKMKSGVRFTRQTRRKRNKRRALMGLQPKAMYRKQLYKRYSHLGNRNFVTYGHRAAKIMNSPEIRKQLKPLWNRLLAEIEKQA